MSENANINVLADPNVAVLEKKPKDDNPTVETASPVGEKRSGEPPSEEESVEEKNGDESIEEEKDDEKAVEEEKDKEPVEEQKGEEQPEVKKDEESSEEKKGEETIGEKKSEEPTEEKIDERVTKEEKDEGAIEEKTDDVTTEEKKDDVKTEEKKDDGATEAKKEKDAAEVQREADLLAELFPTEAENPVTGTADEVVTTTPVEPKKKTNSIASLFKKAEKRPLEERLAEAEKEKASSAEDDASVAAPSAAAAASDTPAKTPAKRAKKAMPPPEADNSKNQDIRTFFKKLPTKDEMFEEKRKVREAEREKQRQLEKKERDNFLYNKEKQRIVPESFHSENFRDVPMGSLLGDAELDKASSMKTVSMQEFLLTMAAKKKREQDIRDGVCVDEPAEPLPPAKKSRKRK